MTEVRTSAEEAFRQKKIKMATGGMKIKEGMMMKLPLKTRILEDAIDRKTEFTLQDVMDALTSEYKGGASVCFPTGRGVC